MNNEHDALNNILPTKYGLGNIESQLALDELDSITLFTMYIKGNISRF